MSYPKKTKGWRSLTLNNQRFRWCFVPQTEDSFLKLQGSSSANQQAIVILQNWCDPWLSIGRADVLPNEPKVITTKFASQAIAFALQNGWQPKEQKQAVYFEYGNGNFGLRENNKKA